MSRDLTDELAEALREMVQRFDHVDNGTCTTCRAGHRLYGTDREPRPCQNTGCASHRWRAVLARYDAARSRGESEDTRTTYYLRCGWCGAYEGTVDPSEPCAKDETGYIGPHQFGIYEPTPEARQEALREFVGLVARLTILDVTDVEDDPQDDPRLTVNALIRRARALFPTPETDR